MAYQRIARPKIYVDMINPLLENGTITGTDQITGSGILTTASSIIQLFDNKPNNAITIGGNGGTTAQNIIVDTNIDTNNDLLGETMFIAILGHNLKSADAQLKIQTDDASDFGSPESPGMTEVYNSETTTSSGNYARPASDGWSLFTYTQNSDNRYQKLIIDDVSTFDTDIKIGCILWGVAYTFPSSPDMNIKRSFSYDGLKINESLGGQKYAHATHLTNSSWTATGAFDQTSEKAFKTGRQQIDMSFSYLTDTDAFPSNLYDMGVSRTDESILNRLIFMTNGGMFPLLLQLDNTENSGDDGWLYCRLKNEPSFTQVANRYWSTNLSFIEEL
ncbi:MAG: hypothetical protein Unbinned6747contig1000_38 [Prokaryotic dsDNA virus sp.]|nr:MAG: hypothetical protein Unbinned6747contig1000_38 [Prokaryotic dsDNA virus sp.]|tara:strand:+ start:11259 stop:12254 length:996 start_codon:yes stop_codon:yes gene_type:complete